MPLTQQDLNALPEEVLAELKMGARSGPSVADRIYAVVPEETPIDINEIIVAVWRNESKVLKRTTVSATITNLRRDGKIRRCGHGSYVRGYEEMPPVQKKAA